MSTAKHRPGSAWVRAALFTGGAFFVFAPGQPLEAGSFSFEATAEIVNETGEVGESTPTPPAEPAPPTNDTGTSSALPAEEGGGVTDPSEASEVAGETTFRPAPESAPPAPAAQPASPAAAAAQAETRLPQNTRAVSNLLGGSSAVGVAGLPNQTFAVSLPGKTVYSGGGGNVVTIDSFVHNAGFTPSLNTQGTGVFVMGAVVGDGQGGGAGATEAAAGSTAEGTETGGAQPAAGSQPGGTAGTSTGGAAEEGGGPGTEGGGPGTEGGGNYAGPVIAASPFINITITYN